MLAAAIFQSEWKLKFKQESRRLWMLLKTLTDGQATDDFERELSCCGFNNALDYCDRKLKSLKSNGSHLMNLDITGALFMSMFIERHPLSGV